MATGLGAGQPLGRAHAMRCTDYCCNYGCNQGENCPARQACELPEPPEVDDGYSWDQTCEALIGVGIAVALVVACLVVTVLVFPLP